LEALLENLNMRINATKSACIRFGPRYDADCANLTMKNGQAISWVTTCRYLGVYFVSGRDVALIKLNRIFFVHSMLYLGKWDALHLKRYF